MPKEKYTKEFIIEYFKKYYENTGRVPRVADTFHPFSSDMVMTKFGKWNNCIVMSNIPLLRNPRVEVRTVPLFHMKLYEIE
jgi:hypothetical protein